MTTSQQELLWRTAKATILQVLRQHGRMYGYQINQAVLDRTDDSLTLSFGLIYPLLHQLERDGTLLTQTAEVDGRLRKYYSIRPSGGPSPTRQTTGLEHLTRLMPLILKSSPVWAVCP